MASGPVAWPPSQPRRIEFPARGPRQRHPARRRVGCGARSRCAATTSWPAPACPGTSCHSTGGRLEHLHMNNANPAYRFRATAPSRPLLVAAAPAFLLRRPGPRRLTAASFSRSQRWPSLARRRRRPGPESPPTRRPSQLSRRIGIPRSAMLAEVVRLLAPPLPSWSQPPGCALTSTSRQLIHPTCRRPGRAGGTDAALEGMAPERRDLGHAGPARRGTPRPRQRPRVAEWTSYVAALRMIPGIAAPGDAEEARLGEGRPRWRWTGDGHRPQALGMAEALGVGGPGAKSRALALISAQAGRHDHAS